MSDDTQQPETPPPPPVTVQEVVDYIKARYGIKRSRQTVYNWMKSGVADAGGEKVKLPCTMIAGQAHTTHADLEAFFARVGGQ